MSEVPLEPIEVPCEPWSRLAQSLGQSSFRRSFLASPGEAERYGLPSEFMDALTELSPAELRLVADLSNRFQFSRGQSPCFF
jgi:hypothetical protein